MTRKGSPRRTGRARKKTERAKALDEGTPQRKRHCGPPDEPQAASASQTGHHTPAIASCTLSNTSGAPGTSKGPPQDVAQFLPIPFGARAQALDKTYALELFGGEGYGPASAEASHAGDLFQSGAHISRGAGVLNPVAKLPQTSLEAKPDVSAEKEFPAHGIAKSGVAPSERPSSEDGNRFDLMSELQSTGAPTNMGSGPNAKSFQRKLSSRIEIDEERLESQTRQADATIPSAKLKLAQITPPPRGAQRLHAVTSGHVMAESLTGHSPRDAILGHVEPSFEAEITPKSRTINALKRDLEDERLARKTIAALSAQVVSDLKEVKEENATLKASNEAKDLQIDFLESREAGRNGEDAAKDPQKPRTSSKGSTAAARKNSLNALRVRVRREAECRGNAIAVAKRDIFDSLVQLIPVNVSRGIQSVSLKDGVLQHFWYPTPIQVKSAEGNGTLTGHSSSTQTVAPSESSEVPENPQMAAMRPPNGGGLFAIPELVAAGGVNGSKAIENLLERWALQCCTEYSPSVTDDAKRAAALLSREQTLVSIVKESISRKASDWKRSFCKRYVELCFKEFFQLPVKKQKSQGLVNLRQADEESVEKLQVNFLKINQAICMSLGGSVADLSSPDGISFSDWAAGREGEVYLFGAWRRCTTSDIQASFNNNLELLLRGFLTEEGAKTSSDMMKVIDIVIEAVSWEVGHVEDDDWASRDVPSILSTKKDGDALFANSHAARSFPFFLGRGCNSSPHFVTGKTSILAIARADAWLATSLTLSRSTDGSGMGSGGMFNAKYNELFSCLLPHATYSLLQELRGHVERLGYEREFKKPFDPSEARRILRDNRRRHGAQALSEAGPSDTPGSTGNGARVSPNTGQSRTPDDTQARQQSRACTEGTPSGSTGAASWSMRRTSKFDEVGALAQELDKVSEVPYAIHGGNPYQNSFRKATLSYHNSKENQDFLLIHPSFFTENICGWIGEVCDAYIGQCSPGAGKYGMLDTPETLDPMTKADEQ